MNCSSRMRSLRPLCNMSIPPRTCDSHPLIHYLLFVGRSCLRELSYRFKLDLWYFFVFFLFYLDINLSSVSIVVEMGYQVRTSALVAGIVSRPASKAWLKASLSPFVLVSLACPLYRVARTSRLCFCILQVFP